MSRRQPTYGFERIARPLRFVSCQALFAAFLFCHPALISAASPSDQPKRTVVVLGDSIAAGYGLEADQSFPAVLQKKIQKAKLNVEVVNAGVSGDTSAGGLRRIDWVLKRNCDVLVLELGGNDGLRGLPVAAMQSNLEKIIERTRAKYPQAQILVAGRKMPPNMGGDYDEAFQQAFASVAEKTKATLIPFLLQNVGGIPMLNLPDHIHPTAEGQKIVAENVWKFLQPVLQKLSS